jgi:hypothetical protein
MAMVFKSQSDSSQAVELVGVGVLYPGGRGGVPVERAAEVMTELQEKNADGSLSLDEDGNPIPLTGSKLTAAAKAFAEARDLDVVNLNDDKIAGLPAEIGTPPDRPPAAESAMADYRHQFGTDEPWDPGTTGGGVLKVFNADADKNVQGQPPYTLTDDPMVPPLPASAVNPKVADEPGVEGGDK